MCQVYFSSKLIAAEFELFYSWWNVAQFEQATYIFTFYLNFNNSLICITSYTRSFADIQIHPMLVFVFVLGFIIEAFDKHLHKRLV